MRPSTLLPLVLFSATVASAQDRLVEASATLALTLAHSGEIGTRPLRNDGALQTSTPGSHRLGNREILEAMVAEGLIDSIRGWRVVGLWAEWLDADPFAGNAYRFFARRGSGASLEHVAVPASILSTEPLVAAIGIRHTRDAADTLVAGTEKVALLDEVNFDLAGHAGLLRGHTTGGGRYVKLKGETEARYFIPSASKSTLVGTYTDDGETAAGVVSGTLKFSAAKMLTLPASASGTAGSFDSMSGGSLTVGAAVFNTDWQSTSAIIRAIGDENTEPDENDSADVSGSAGLIQTGTGTLTLNGANTFTGTTTLIGGTLGGTGVIGGSLNLDLNLGSLSPGDTYTLFNGDGLLFTPTDLVTFSGDGFSGIGGTFTLSPDGTLIVTPVPAP